MSVTKYEIRLCPSCGLRYPLTENHSFGDRCPSCLGETQVILKRDLGYAPLPTGEGTELRAALLDNIRSAWNVGSIFRSADGLGVDKLYLCGITPTPKNEAVAKTSLGAEKDITWEYSRNALETANCLKAGGHTLLALEQHPRAIPLRDYLPERSATQSQGMLMKDVLLLGNEVTGVDPELLDLCDHILYIPMRGRKRSFNVEVAFAIAACILAKV